MSELGYYLDDTALALFLQGVDRCLANDGELVACHFRPDFDDRLQATDALHDALGSLRGLVPILKHQESAFALAGWHRQHEG
ncbi:hypothetical protein D3C72_1664860 [compost metagenome]